MWLRRHSTGGRSMRCDDSILAMTQIFQKVLPLLQHPWAPAVAVGLLALLLGLARCSKGRGQALDGGRTCAVFIILFMLTAIAAALVITWQTWGSSNPSIYYLVTIAGIFVTAAVGIATIAFTWNQNKASNTVTIEKHTEIVLEQDRKYRQLEQKMNSVEESHQKEQKRSKEQEEALANLQGQLPEAQIEKAQVDLRHGNKQAAKQAFAAVRQHTGKIAALAAYYGGQIAEEELNYTEAMSLYRDAVTLEPNNPDYLLTAGLMARIMGDYQHAEEWLKHRLIILEQRERENAE